jgi:hypothetical protein
MHGWACNITGQGYEGGALQLKERSRPRNHCTSHCQKHQRNPWTCKQLLQFPGSSHCCRSPTICPQSESPAAPCHQGTVNHHPKSSELHPAVPLPPPMRCNTALCREHGWHMNQVVLTTRTLPHSTRCRSMSNLQLPTKQRAQRQSAAGHARRNN